MQKQVVIVIDGDAVRMIIVQLIRFVRIQTPTLPNAVSIFVVFETDANVCEILTQLRMFATNIPGRLSTK